MQQPVFQLIWKADMQSCCIKWATEILISFQFSNKSHCCSVAEIIYWLTLTSVLSIRQVPRQVLHRQGLTPIPMQALRIHGLVYLFFIFIWFITVIKKRLPLIEYRHKCPINGLLFEIRYWKDKMTNHYWNICFFISL